MDTINLIKTMTMADVEEGSHDLLVLAELTSDPQQHHNISRKDLAEAHLSAQAIDDFAELVLCRKWSGTLHRVGNLLLMELEPGDLLQAESVHKLMEYFRLLIEWCRAQQDLVTVSSNTLVDPRDSRESSDFRRQAQRVLDRLRDHQTKNGEGLDHVFRIWAARFAGPAYHEFKVGVVGEELLIVGVPPRAQLIVTQPPKKRSGSIGSAKPRAASVIEEGYLLKTVTGKFLFVRANKDGSILKAGSKITYAKADKKSLSHWYLVDQAADHDQTEVSKNP